jgi:hypothetical protein
MKTSEQPIAASVAEAIPDLKSAQPTAAEGKKPRVATDSKPPQQRSTATRRRRTRQENSESSGEERFFLASGSGNGGIPALGRECGSEAEAIIDAFRERVNFYRVSEFQTRADVGPSGEPILRKDGLKKTNSAS